MPTTSEKIEAIIAAHEPYLHDGTAVRALARCLAAELDRIKLAEPEPDRGPRVGG